MSQTLQAIRGMNDILPDDAELWEQFEDTLRGWLRDYGYRPIRMPLVEPTPLFARAIGAGTDIVEKETYSFADGLNGELIQRPHSGFRCLAHVDQRISHGGSLDDKRIQRRALSRDALDGTFQCIDLLPKIHARGCAASGLKLGFQFG